MPAAVAIPLIYAAGQATSTYLQNRAQNKATEAQTAANASTQQVQQQANADAQQRIAATGQQQSALYSPYLNLGAGAASTLASRLGLPSGPAPGLTSPTMTAAHSNTQLTPVDPGNAQGIVSNPQGPPLSDPNADQRTRGSLAQIGTAVQRTQAQNATQSGYVTMRSPDGEVAQVPPEHVEFYKAKGGQVVP